MNKEKKVSTIYYAAAVCFYIAAIVGFANDNTTQAVIMMSLGSAQLCLGSMWLKKSKDKEE